MCLNWVAVAADDLVNSPLMPGIKYDRFAQCKAEFSEVHMPCHGLEYHPTNGSLASYQSSFKVSSTLRKSGYLLSIYVEYILPLYSICSTLV